ncbi:MAG: hypothetical protein ABIL09_24495 [Gemmatimonadota bacterium]
MADWAGRDTGAHDVRRVRAAPLHLGLGDYEVRVLSHAVGGQRHYGAAVVPAGSEPTSRPIVLYTHFGQPGSGPGVSVDDVLVLLGASGALRHDVVYAIPSYRSQSLTAAGSVYVSEGVSDPWDGQVDDALAFLEVVRQAVREADTSRVAAVGLSGGATVALLAALRDPGVDAVVEYFAPVDFLGDFVEGIFEQALAGDLPDLPGATYLQEAVIEPLQRGDTDLSAVRLELIRRSPVYFADRLPHLQAHHGRDDAVVPVAQTRRLETALKEAPNGAGWQVFLYEVGGHNPLALAGSAARVERFLDDLVGEEAGSGRLARAAGR